MNEAAIGDPGNADVARVRPQFAVATAHAMEKPPPRETYVWAVLTAILIAYATLRLPVMYRQPGGLDEEIYAVPGWTILENGVPRLPHVPARNAESVFFHADEVMYLEPPLYFYWQALFYAFLPPVYGTARLASGVAGCITIVLVYFLGRSWTGNAPAALWGAGLYSLSRWFYFAAIRARPDLLCTMFGIAALLVIWNWTRSRRSRSLVGAGVLVGLGGLTHGFAIVYAVQIAGWVFAVSQGRRRLGNVLIVAGVSMGVALLWVPLILLRPDVFRVQFTNQFLHGSGGPLWERLLWPWESIAFHAANTWIDCGPIQTVLTMGTLVGTTAWSLTSWGREIRPLCWLSWSAMALLCVLVGPHHSVMGYWSFPGALLFIMIGAALVAGGRQLPGSKPLRTAATVLGGCALVALLCRGAGLRAWATYVAHWDDVNYNEPLFARGLLDETPTGATVIMDRQFMLDFVVAGRNVLQAETDPMYFRAQDYDYDLLIGSRDALNSRIAETLHAKHIRSLGIKQDEFACYAEVYVPREGGATTVQPPARGE